MNRIDRQFQDLRARNSKGFVAFIMGGDPNPETCYDLVLELDRAGVDVLELGVPFSDPLADGTVNQNAASRALRHGVSLKMILELVEKLRQKTNIPIVLFTYLNPVLKYGYEKFALDASAAGVDGVLTLDLPPEEAGSYKSIMDNADLKTIFLLAPTSTNDRMKLVSQFASGFIYYVSLTGVTGVRNSLANDIGPMVTTIKKFSSLPVAVGFGVSNPEQAAAVAGFADAVVVGSAIVQTIADNFNNRKNLIPTVGRLVRDMVEAVKELK